MHHGMQHNHSQCTYPQCRNCCQPSKLAVNQAAWLLRSKTISCVSTICTFATMVVHGRQEPSPCPPSTAGTDFHQVEGPTKFAPSSCISGASLLLHLTAAVRQPCTVPDQLKLSLTYPQAVASTAEAAASAPPAAVAAAAGWSSSIGAAAAGSLLLPLPSAANILP